MPLSLRQELAYTHSCDLWEPATPKSLVTGRVTGVPAYTLRYTGVACHFVYRQSVESPSPLGRSESDDHFSRDAVLFAEDQVVDSGWVVVNKSINDDGDPVPKYGRGLVVAGDPASHNKEATRDAGRRKVEGRSYPADKLPAGVG